MTWIIALFGIAAVVGSVMWLKPSPAQQRQARLRMQARRLGLDVRLAPLPQTHRAKVRRETAEPGVVYRRLRFDLSDRRRPACVWVRDGADAEWERQGEALAGALLQAMEAAAAQLPRDAAALELTPQGPGVYWRERGDEQTVIRMNEALTGLAAALAGA